MGACPADILVQINNISCQIQLCEDQDAVCPSAGVSVLSTLLVESTDARIANNGACIQNMMGYDDDVSRVWSVRSEETQIVSVLNRGVDEPSHARSLSSPLWPCTSNDDSRSTSEDVRAQRGRVVHRHS